jgi:hypothetical protein
MGASGRNLTLRQQKTIMALLQEPTIEKAAALASVGEASVYRWLRQDGFRHAYQVARREAVSQTVARLQKVSSEAADVLACLMRNGELPGSVRLGAAKSVLEMSLKGLETEDLSARIETLEKRLSEGGGPWRR